MKKKMIIISSAILATLITGTVLFLPRDAKATDEKPTTTTEAPASETEESLALSTEDPEDNPVEYIKATTEEMAESIKSREVLSPQVAANKPEDPSEQVDSVNPIAQGLPSVTTEDKSKDKKTQNLQPGAVTPANLTNKDQKQSAQQAQPSEASEKGTNETNSEKPTVSTKDTESTTPVSVNPEDEKPKTPIIDTSSKKEDTKPTKSEASVETKTEKPAEKKTEAPKCKHTWVWATHTETKTIPEVCHDVPVYDDGWDEPVYAQKVYCSECESLYDSSEAFYAKDHCHGNSGLITVVDHYIHHEPEILYYDTIVDQPERQETVTVKDYQYCSICGERK